MVRVSLRAAVLLKRDSAFFLQNRFTLIKFSACMRACWSPSLPAALSGFIVFMWRKLVANYVADKKHNVHQTTSRQPGGAPGETV